GGQPGFRFEDFAGKEIGAGVRQLAAVQVWFLYRTLEGTVGADEGNSKSPRLIAGMHQHTRRTPSQRGKVSGSVKIIAVQHHKATRADLLAARAQGIRGAARHFLTDNQP